MKGFRFFKGTLSIDFIGRRHLTFFLSSFLVLASLALFSVRGLNLGIDFLGGTTLEVKTKGPAPLSPMRSALARLKMGDFSLQTFGAPDTVLIKVQGQKQESAEQKQKRITAVKKALASYVKAYEKVEVVGPVIGHELQGKALWAVTLSLGVILLYIWIRFEWQFGVCAVLALFHDVIATIGLFSLFRMEFNLSTVAALLTIAGYSINDTVVVYDRVREIMRKHSSYTLKDIFNMSINQTLSRTVVTSLTTMLALLALVSFGGEVIRGFSVAMLWGIAVGTYSSIALAVPLLLYIRLDRTSPEEDA